MFKTDCNDEIPEGGTTLYNLVNTQGTIVQQNIKIVRSNKNQQEGDVFGAYQLNQIHAALNIALFPISQESGYLELGTYDEYLKSIEK